MLVDGIAGMDVRDVHLDDGAGEHPEGIEQRNGLETEARGVDHDDRLLAEGVVHPLDDLVLGVGLREEELEPQLARHPFAFAAHVVKCRGAVQLRLSQTEHVQVRAVQDEELPGHGSFLSGARATSSRAASAGS